MEFLTDEQLAQHIPLSLSFIRKDRRGRQLLPFTRVGDRCLYSLERVQQALLAREVGGQAQQPRRRAVPRAS